jgi:predicted nucleic acid-binding protein
VIVAADTNVFIYWLDAASQYHEAAKELLSKLDLEKLHCATLAATEILSKPGIPKSVVDIIPAQWVDLTTPIAQQAGLLRQGYAKLSTQDAIHLATAISVNAKLFYTNDKQLLNLKKVGSLQIRPIARK